MTLIERSFRERIVLVGVQSWPRSLQEVEESLDELASLVYTAGADEVDRLVQSKNILDPATLIGTGKAEELHLLCERLDVDTVVFDEDLTPAQHRNLEKILGRTAIDRTGVILDIFAQNARTEEGCLQVELAILRYRLPRLRGRGVSLSKQSAGIGTRGPGETKLESDRRRITRRIAALERQLKELEVKRSVQRKARGRSQIPSIALVGYTNAGKSTLLNALTEANALVQDRLFSTLDPKTKKLVLPGGEEIICSDTVGFVKKLPHQLVESFRSTMEEVRTADLLLHVVDSHANDPVVQMEAVRQVLHEVEADDVDELIVFNKADLDLTQARKLHNLYSGSVIVSAAKKENIDELIQTIAERLHSNDKCISLHIPYTRGDLIDLLHKKCHIISENSCEKFVEITAKLREQFIAKLSPFIVMDNSTENELKTIDNLQQ